MSTGCDILSHLRILTRPPMFDILCEMSEVPMAMHILPAYYTTTNLRKPKRKDQEQSKHNAWLKKMGLTSNQICKRYNDLDIDPKSKNAKWRSEYSASLQVDRSTKHHEKSVQEVCNGGVNATANRSVMANLHKENEETREAILAKAKRVMPLYNKGGLQVLSESDDLKALNKTVRV
jgi:hypothetical protein